MYALQLLEISEQIIGDVHDAGPAEVLAHLHRVRKLPCPAGVDPVAALVTVLAAQVDPDSTESQRLGWVEAIGERRRAG
jgi:hypothetical protein